MALQLTFGNMQQYRLVKKIGAGSFGKLSHLSSLPLFREVYIGRNVQTGEDVAIKLESAKVAYPLLGYEAHVYRNLSDLMGIPSLRWYGNHHGYNALVLDILGPSLEDLFNFCNRKFSLKTVLQISEQLLVRLEQLHSRGFIHRDIKPENFLIGVGKRDYHIYMVDFGLSNRYRDAESEEHIAYAEHHKNLTGTARYASIDTHLGIEQSRRNDLASLGYMLIYFLRGELPWQGVEGGTKQERHDKILALKQSVSTQALCEGLPSEFEFYMNYASSLRFQDKPDYPFLRGLLRDLFVRKGFSYDRKFDWSLRMDHRGQASVPTLQHYKSRRATRAPPAGPPSIPRQVPNSVSGPFRDVWGP
ncbi:hypothetical protein PCASD_04843 [Puccinia coronata f. sp. avenae]|uniref:non-specific serine/threonine protein kinase n=1 Tax=Puccinia coronata f. sp. avenae TaxID=200324 RepID=A0A2N5V233_9BASI|nr:hypothetical protein PCASD_04843 [Puccinia coronata f. sp. avenae]